MQKAGGGTIQLRDVHYFVVEEGVYNEVDDGINMEAWTEASTATARKGSWVMETRSLNNTYTNPVILGQVQFYNEYGILKALAEEVRLGQDIPCLVPEPNVYKRYFSCKAGFVTYENWKELKDKEFYLFTDNIHFFNGEIQALSESDRSKQFASLSPENSTYKKTVNVFHFRAVAP